MKIQVSVVSFAAAIADAGSACKLSAALAFLLAACPPSALHAAVEVLVEGNSGANWKFQTVPNPSRSDIAREGKLTLAGNQPEECCLSPDGLHNGVLPWQGKQTRDFFAFSNWNTNGGRKDWPTAPGRWQPTHIQPRRIHAGFLRSGMTCKQSSCLSTVPAPQINQITVMTAYQP